MRTLNNFKLLIDADCPMCQLYGNAFESCNLVEKGTISPYQITADEIALNVDMERARNEIALYHIPTKEVKYGIDSLLHILTQNFPFLNSVVSYKPVNWFLRKLYKFVSYNRKVIVPAKRKPDELNCSPDLNIKYRLAYLLTVVFLSSFILFHFTKPINQLLSMESHFGRELLICLGQIIWQTIFLFKLPKDKLYEYLGNMMTVSLIGSLLLLPLVLFQNFSPLFYLVYFLIVVGFMLIEHIRRCKVLELGLRPSISWFTYRIVVLLILAFL